MPEIDHGINDPDREPHRRDGGYGWYIRIDHTTYGFYATAAAAWEVYDRIRDETYEEE